MGHKILSLSEGEQVFKGVDALFEVKLSFFGVGDDESLVVDLPLVHP